MPNAALLCEIHVPPGHAIRFSADDLRNFYHAIPGSEERARSTPVGDVFVAGDFEGWRCARPDLLPTANVYLAWNGIAMGDHNAVDWAQELHTNLLQQAGVLRLKHWLVYPKALPLNFDGFYEGVMIDDRVGVQVFDRSKPEASHVDRDSFATSDAAYLRVGLERHAGTEKRQVFD